MYNYTALVTLLSMLCYFTTSAQVARARTRYGVAHPAISGNVDFERVFRVQMNMLEWLPIFLTSLWLFAIYIGDAAAAAVGAVWIVGRIFYMIGYMRSVAGRAPGFFIQALATAVLLFGALGAIVWRIVHA